MPMEQQCDIFIADRLGTVALDDDRRFLSHLLCLGGNSSFKFNGRAMEIRNGDLAIVRRRDMLEEIRPSADFRCRIIYATPAFIELCTPRSNYGMRGSMALFLNPVANSYDRFGLFEAPSSISWGTGNRGLLIRMPEAKNEHAKRLEVRSADPSCNPYLAFLLLASAAEEGIRTSMKLPCIEEGGRLPENLKEAVEAAEGSEFVRSILPEHLVECFLEAKKTDWHTAAESGYPKVAARDMEFLVT